jgi:hydrogenase nickel incorporation protein HypA/HybF
MHEMSIAQNIIEALSEQVKEINYNKIKNVKIKIGELTAVDSNSLKFSFDIITKDTKFEGVNLEIETVQLKALCNICNFESPIENFFFICSNCNSTDIKVLQGDELNLSEIEIE